METKGEKISIIEVETDLLDESNFRPDEDFIEQVTGLDKQNAAGIKGKTTIQRTKYIRNHLDEFSGFWKSSLEHLGNCGYKGVITGKAITKVAVVDISRCKEMCFEAVEPVITLMNFKICGKQFRMINRWFMGEPISVEEWFQNQSVNPLSFTDEKGKSIHDTEVFQIAGQSEVHRNHIRLRYYMSGKYYRHGHHVRTRD